MTAAGGAASDPIPPTMVVPVFAGEERIELAERAVPEPGAGEVLLRVAANAMCGTDRLQYRFGSPVTPGHEVAGTVVAAGETTTTPIGTRGVVFLMGYCGRCRSCRAGHTNQCLDKHGDIGFERDGGYGRYAAVPERQLHPVPDDIDLVDATLLLDAMGTSGHALERARLVRPDLESVVVTGAGPIGLGVVVMAKLILGDDVPVVVTDLSPYRLGLAEALGAVAVDVGRGATVSEAARAAGIGSPDVAFDATGREEARRQALDALGKRGVLVCIGHGHGLTLKVSPDLIASERAVLGSEYFRIDELDANIERLRRHRDRLASLITHRFAVDDIVAAFGLFMSGETGKAVVLP